MEEADPRYHAIHGPWGDRKTSQKEMSSRGAQNHPGGISILICKMGPGQHHRNLQH